MANLVKNGNFDIPDIPSSSTAIPTYWSSAVGTTNAGFADLAVGIPSAGLPAGISQFVYLVYQNNYGFITQDIIFKTGNYVLSFWSRANIDATNFNYVLQPSIGGNNLTTVSYKSGTDPWKQTVIPFNITNTSTQTLKFITTSTIFISQIYLTGVSIVSADYTLDLYLEWIPDEYVEEQHKNIKNK